MRKTIGISRNKLVILTELRRERKQQQFQSDYKQSNRYSLKSIQFFQTETSRIDRYRNEYANGINEKTIH